MMLISPLLALSSPLALGHPPCTSSLGELPEWSSYSQALSFSFLLTVSIRSPAAFTAQVLGLLACTVWPNSSSRCCCYSSPSSSSYFFFPFSPLLSLPLNFCKIFLFPRVLGPKPGPGMCQMSTGRCSLKHRLRRVWARV